MRHVVIDAAGNVVNAFEWDGVSNWPTPSNHTVQQSDVAGLGWTFHDGVFTPPAAAIQPPPTPEQVRAEEFVADADRQDLVSRLQTATPAQIKTYVINNVTDLASAKVLLMKRFSYGFEGVGDLRDRRWRCAPAILE